MTTTPRELSASAAFISDPTGEQGSKLVDVKFEWNKALTQRMESNFVNGLVDMGLAVRNLALSRAPYVTGALKNSIRVDATNAKEGTVDVIAGGISAPMDRLTVSASTGRPIRVAGSGLRFVNYAAKREEGPNRDPSTVGYMSRSLWDIMNTDWQHKYFGGIVQ